MYALVLTHLKSGQIPPSDQGLSVEDTATRGSLQALSYYAHLDVAPQMSAPGRGVHTRRGYPSGVSETLKDYIPCLNTFSTFLGRSSHPHAATKGVPHGC